MYKLGEQGGNRGTGGEQGNSGTGGGKVLHTEASTHSKLLHTEVFTHRSFCTQRRYDTRKLVHTASFYFTHRTIHTDAFTHRSFYTQEPFYSDALTRGSLCTLLKRCQQKLHSHRLATWNRNSWCWFCSWLCRWWWWIWMKVHPVHRRVWPSRAPASQNPVHTRRLSMNHLTQAYMWGANGNNGRQGETRRREGGHTIQHRHTCGETIGDKRRQWETRPREGGHTIQHRHTCGTTMGDKGR